MTVEEGFAPVVAKKGFEYPFGGRGYAEGHGSAGEAFAKADDVGFLAEVFAGEDASGAAETCQDFIGNAEDALFMFASDSSSSSSPA